MSNKIKYMIISIFLIFLNFKIKWNTIYHMTDIICELQ